jgi:DNA helicase-2/ATP-dependent DNA helicase PcrA
VISYTDEQNKIINHGDEHCVVSAVPGSGKTQTLVGRIKKLLLNEDKSKILVLMFNTDAVKMFKRKCEKEIESGLPEINTFNSYGVKLQNLLIDYGALIRSELVTEEYKKNTLAKKSLIEAYKRSYNKDIRPDPKLQEDFLKFIGLVKSNILSPKETFKKGRYKHEAAVFPMAFDIFEKYRKIQKIHFYDDQLYDPITTLMNNPRLLRYVEDKYKYLIADEAQDINGIQAQLIKFVSGSKTSVMVVGDEDQSIYEWRGADPEYLTNTFFIDYPGALRYNLSYTFRYGHELSILANHLISNNKNRNDKFCISHESTPETIITCLGLDEATDIANEVTRNHEAGISYSQMAILVRTYGISFPIEIELIKNNIPYHIYGRKTLVQIREVASLLAILYLARGSSNITVENDVLLELYKDALSFPTLYLNSAEAASITRSVINNDMSISEAIRNVASNKEEDYKKNHLNARADMLDIFCSGDFSKDSPSTILEAYWDNVDLSGAVTKSASSIDEANKSIETAKSFLELSKRYDSISSLFNELNPLITLKEKEIPKEPHVWIGSIHKSKGEEWNIVFVPGLSYASFPSEFADIQAERRLCYVAFTRAVKHLYICHPKDKDFSESLTIDNSDMESEKSTVSCFLWESRVSLTKYAADCIKSNTGPSSSVKSKSPDIVNRYFQSISVPENWEIPVRYQHRISESTKKTLRVGMRVRHHIFGAGTVTKSDDGRLVTVLFDDKSSGSRIFVIKSANL